MGRFFRFLVYFQTSPMEICWSGADWFYTGSKTVKYHVGLGWFHRFHGLAIQSSRSTHCWLVLQQLDGNEQQRRDGR